MRAIITFLLIMLAVDLHGQSLPEIDTDRPDQTESSSVLPVSTLQIEAGVHSEGGSASKTYSLPALLVRYAPLDWLELRAIAEYNRFERSGELVVLPAMPSGATTFGAGTKIQLTRENGALPEIALLAHLLVGSVIGDSSESVVTPEFRFSMGHSLPGDLALGYNLGGEWENERETLIGVYTIALGFPIGPEFGGYVELFGDYDEEISSSFDAGITYVPQNNLQLDLSAGTGLTTGTPNHYFGVGVSYRLPH